MKFTDLDPTKVKTGDKTKLDVNVDRLDPFSSNFPEVWRKCWLSRPDQRIAVLTLTYLTIPKVETHFSNWRLVFKIL
jgi:hypothetical protein